MAMINTMKIRTDGGTQARAKLDNATVMEYQEAMSNGKWPFPPIIVYYDGEVYWLADGFHRVEAARREGRYKIMANVQQGTQREAILHAVGANAEHGLRRTSEDKRRAVIRLLEDDEWSQWSDREIARRCKVSNRFVSNLRQDVTVNGSQSERKYVTRHGTTAVMQTRNIGSQAQKEYKQLMPELAYDWLKNYRDKKGRTWKDLEDNEVHHANSPCYQAFVAKFPRLKEPKFYLKQALAQLKIDKMQSERGNCVNCNTPLTGPGWRWKNGQACDRCESERLKVLKQKEAEKTIKYAEVWELEQGVNAWVTHMKYKEWIGRIPETVYNFTMPKIAQDTDKSTYWKGLVDFLQEPWRKRDVVQAIDNVKEQLRQQAESGRTPSKINTVEDSDVAELDAIIRRVEGLIMKAKGIEVNGPLAVANVNLHKARKEMLTAEEV